MKIDAYSHFCCHELLDHFATVTRKKHSFSALFEKIPTLMNADLRLAFMDERHLDVSVLVPLPWIESVPAIAGCAEDAMRACRIANTAMSRVVARAPDRFVGVALLPTGDAAAMEQELIYALDELGLAGGALFVGPTVRPLDDERFEPLFALAAARDAPLWLHPCRPQQVADYETYAAAGSLHRIWCTLGWIYDTSVAMVHLCMAGVLRRHPQLKLVAHHHGGLIPFFADRFETQNSNFFAEDKDHLLGDLAKFYCDTATFGFNPTSVRQALCYFGESRVMYGTDSPMDMARPGFFMEMAERSIDILELSIAQRAAVYAGNATQLLGARLRRR
jgi:uncharacterized protein